MRQDGLDRLEDLGRKRRGREEEGGYEKSRRWPFYRAHSLSPSTKCFGLHLRAHLPSHAKSYDHGSTAQSAEPTVPYTRDSTNKRSQHVYGPIVTKYYNSYLPHAAIPTISTPLSIHLPLTTDRYASAYRLIFAFS